MSKLDFLLKAYEKLSNSYHDELTKEEMEILTEYGFFNSCDDIFKSPAYDVPVIIELIDKRAKAPVYASEGDAGMDTFACLVDEETKEPLSEIILPPKKTIKVPLGFKCALPLGWYLAVVPRSGISANTPLRISNSPGTIDAGFRGELCVLVTNTSDYTAECSTLAYPCSEKGNRQGSYVIRTGDKVAQLIPTPAYKARIILGNMVDEIGINRGGGFGHTGV